MSYYIGLRKQHVGGNQASIMKCGYCFIRINHMNRDDDPSIIDLGKMMSADRSCAKKYLQPGTNLESAFACTEEVIRQGDGLTFNVLEGCPRLLVVAHIAACRDMKRTFMVEGFGVCEVSDIHEPSSINTLLTEWSPDDTLALTVRSPDTGKLLIVMRDDLTRCQYTSGEGSVVYYADAGIYDFDSCGLEQRTIQFEVMR